MALISRWTGLMGSYIAYGHLSFSRLTGAKERCGEFGVFESVLKFQNLPHLESHAIKNLKPCTLAFRYVRRIDASFQELNC